MKRNNLPIFIFAIILLQTACFKISYAQQSDNQNSNQFEKLLLPDNADQNNSDSQIKNNVVKDNSNKIKDGKNLLNNKDDNASAIMITPDERQGIDLILESIKNGREIIFSDFDLYDEDIPEVLPAEIDIESDKINENAFIYLASIIYRSDNDWTIWLNDSKYSSNSNNPIAEIYIKDITSNNVSILWKLSLSKWRILSGNDDDSDKPLNINENNQVEIEFTLMPNQTFSLKAESILEGRVKFN